MSLMKLPQVSHQLLLGFFGIGFSILVLVSIFIFQNDVQRQENAFYSHTEQIVTTSKPLILLGAFFGNTVVLENFFSSLLLNSSFQFIEVKQHSGKTYSFGEFDRNYSYIQQSFPIKIQAKAGEITFFAKRDNIFESAQKKSLNLFAIGGLLICLLSVFLVVFFNLFISNPINKLSKHINDFKSDQDFENFDTTNFEQFGDNEITHLAHSINQMISKSNTSKKQVLDRKLATVTDFSDQTFSRLFS